MAILLNLAFNHFTAGNSDQQSVFVAGTERSLCFRDVSELRDGDYFKGGKLFDAEGREIPLVADVSRKAHKAETTEV